MFAMLKLLPVGVQIGLAAGAFVLITGSATAFYFHIYNKGYASAIAAVAARDKGALDAVREATIKVDECWAAGRSWDSTVGVCN